ncbi:MAG TPA: histidine phosphatase family protein [Candidatus Dormibacteraeota bacterium]|nr:histidine phosphatase family protein [Candidatus Dormibacteraeota bacterium]
MRSARSARARGRRDREREPLAPLRPARDDGQARLTLDIYLARHGETEWSRNGRHTGRTDLPLTPEGEEEARALRERLSGLVFDAVFSSPLQRATRTAELAGFPGPRVTPLLSEFDYGDYEGLTTKEIWEKHPAWELYRDGCPGGETPAQVYARAGEFLRLCEAVDGRVLAFAHGHILRAVAVAWLRLDIVAAAGLQLDVATLGRLRDDPDHGRVLAMWNAP